MKNNMETLGKRLKELRKKKNYTQQFIADKTSVQRGNISHYEKGSVLPSAETIVALAKLFEVSTDYILLGKENSSQNKIVYLYGKEETLRKEIKDLIESLEQLNEENLYVLKRYLDFLTFEQNKSSAETYETDSEDADLLCTESESEYSLEDFDEDDASSETKNLHMKAFSAAGEPIEFPENPYAFEDFIRVPKTHKADSILTIKGDSMEPDIPDGSIVFVHEQPYVETGEIAIVSLDNAITCKKFYRYADRIELVSINKKYKPIVIREEDNIDIRIIGKVLQ